MRNGWVCAGMIGIACITMAAIFLCSHGFFNLKDLLTSTPPSTVDQAAVQPESILKNDFIRNTSLNHRLFDRLVFVVIDALRADMVLGSQVPLDTFQKKLAEHPDLSLQMPYIRGLYNQGLAQAYVSYASVPTVTMPRLKAMTTGKTPAFIDLINNFNSKALHEDSLIQRFHEAGYRLVLYGDDTWLKLFPHSFGRSDGTSGFFTKDTVEVDANVTRHLVEELDPLMEHPKSKDWDVLVMHYLGLDHVGHLRGPRSSLMKDKMEEMDEAMRKIYSSIQAQDHERKDRRKKAGPTLLVLCSDHGMTETGNHGGASDEESSALMMFLNLPGQKSVNAVSIRHQMDLVPTIATLFGLEIPVMNTGKILEEILHNAVHRDFGVGLSKLYSNLMQLWKLTHLKKKNEVIERNRKKIDEIRTLMQIHGNNQSSLSKEDYQIISGDISSMLGRLQEELVSDDADYKTPFIFGGIALMTLSLGIGLVFVHPTMDHDCTNVNVDRLYLIIGFVAFLTSMGSSSSIENEHATWNFITTSLLVVELVRVVRDLCRAPPLQSRSTLWQSIFLLSVMMVSLRVMRNRNQVINFARLNNLPHHGDNTISVISTDALINVPLWFSYLALWFVQLIKSLVLYYQRLLGNVKYSLLVTLVIYASILTMACNYATRDQDRMSASDDQNINQSRLAHGVYLGCFCLLILACLSRQSFVLASIQLDAAFWALLCLLQRDNNLPTFVIIAILLSAFSIFAVLTERLHKHVPAWVDAFWCFWLGQCAFFALGNSHVVATIDISKSYAGLSSFAQGLVGLLTLLSTFAGPILSCLCVFHLSAIRHADKEVTRFVSHVTTASVFILVQQLMITVVYSIIVYFMRFHLFIWSVFAPRVLYQYASTIMVIWLMPCISGIACIQYFMVGLSKINNNKKE